MASSSMSMGNYPVPSVVRPEFKSAFHRTDRVAKHLKCLKSQILPWRKSEGCKLITRSHLDSREKTVHIQYGELPPEWSTITGDILQGLRNALDNAIFGMAEACAPQPLTERQAKGLSFPIYGKEPLPKAEADIKLAFVPVLVREFIELVQPNINWDPSRHVDLLWILRELANTDKHREMHLGVIQVKQIRVRPAEGEKSLNVEQLFMEPPGSVLDDDGELACYIPLEGFEKNLQYDLSLEVVFKDPGSVRYRPVVGVLEDLSQRVFDVVIEMASRYERVVEGLGPSRGK